MRETGTRTKRSFNQHCDWLSDSYQVNREHEVRHSSAKAVCVSVSSTLLSEGQPAPEGSSQAALQHHLLHADPQWKSGGRGESVRCVHLMDAAASLADPATAASSGAMLLLS